MHRTRSKRRQLIRSTVVYSVMTTLVVIGLAIALLYVMGYRFDSEKKTIDQGGLIQVESRPSGANLFVDSEQLPGKTPRQVNASAGSHTIRMTKEGYRPWQKTITVEAGGVHWLNYTLLVPEKLTDKVLATFTNVAATSPLPNGSQILVMESLRKPVFKLLTPGSQTKPKTIELPVELQPKMNGRYIMHDWSYNSRSLLLEYKTPKQSYWYTLDVRDTERSVDLASIVGASQQLAKVNFVAGSDSVLYGLSAGEIRRIDLSQRAVSAPLAQKVSQYWQSDQGVVTYVSDHDEATNTRKLGYITPGAKESRIIQTVFTSVSTPLRLVAGEYHNRDYLAIQNASTIDINRVNLRSSDSDEPIDMTSIAVINTEEAANSLTISPNNRFIVAQHDATYSNYDIELARLTSTTLRGTEKINQPIAWLDSYHVWSTRESQLRIYEFDGENVQSFGAVTPGLSPLLSRNSEFLYVFRTSADKTTQLVQIPLRVK